MKLSIGVRSFLNNTFLLCMVFGLQACGGGGGGAAPNAAPVFTSSTEISVNENTTATGYTAAATDAENNAVTFSLSGGADEASLSIDSATGILSFNSAQDFEAAADSDTNNSYVVAITATDGTNSVNQTVTVTVTNVNEAPVFTSAATSSVAENNTAIGYTAAATDPESSSITYSLTSGADQTKFSIDSASGALSFQSAADFETPTDADTNNTYLVDVTATDGTNTVVKNVTVTVTNVNEITGYYSTGTHTLGFSDLQALVSGNRLMFMTNRDSVARGSNLFFDGLMTITGTNYTANLIAYTNSLNPVPVTVTGSFIDESSITGVITGGGASIDGTFNLNFATTNNQISDLANINKFWIGSFTIIDAFEIDATGQVISFADIPLNTTFLGNCSVSTGPAFQAIASTNLLSVNFTLSGCTNNTDANGTYTGLATLYSKANPYSQLVLLVSNTNQLVAIPDDMTP